MKKRNLGFTLIELMVVMAIIAILAVLFIGAITIARNSAKETTNRTNAKTLQIALEAKFTSNQAYPALGTLAAAPNMSFNTAAGAANLDVELANAPTGCTAGYEGGGRIASSNTAAALTFPTNGGTAKVATVNYIIIPANAGCTADMPGSSSKNVVAGP